MRQRHGGDEWFVALHNADVPTGTDDDEGPEQTERAGGDDGGGGTWAGGDGAAAAGRGAGWASAAPPRPRAAHGSSSSSSSSSSGGGGGGGGGVPNGGLGAPHLRLGRAVRATSVTDNRDGTHGVKWRLDVAGNWTMSVQVRYRFVPFRSARSLLTD